MASTRSTLELENDMWRTRHDFERAVREGSIDEALRVAEEHHIARAAYRTACLEHTARHSPASAFGHDSQPADDFEMSARWRGKVYVTQFSAIRRMLTDDTSCEAVDGCDGIEPDGKCQHGAPAWPRAVGLI